MVARIWYIELISSCEKPITLRALITALWLVRSLLVVFREKNKDFALKKCQYRSVQKKKTWGQVLSHVSQRKRNCLRFFLKASTQIIRVRSSRWLQRPLWCTCRPQDRSVDEMTPASHLSLRAATVKHTTHTQVQIQYHYIIISSYHRSCWNRWSEAYLVKRVEVPLPVLLVDHPGLEQENRLWQWARHQLQWRVKLTTRCKSRLFKSI